MWKEENNSLHRRFEFGDFTEAFSFMSAVAVAAESQNHHPDWRNVYNRVDITLSTHDAGDIVTDKDHKLAATIDGIFQAIQAAKND